MKILHITPRLHIGGAEIVVKDLALLAKHAGHDVSILTFSKANNHIVDEVVANQINLVQLPHKSPYSPFSLLFLLKHLRSESYDIVHTHMPLRHKYLAIINYLKSSTLPLITTEHVNQYKHLAKKPIDRWTYKQYARVISCSHDMQNEILFHLPALKSKCRVIHNGVDYEKLSKIKNKANTRGPHAPLQALTLARLDKQKDLVTCIRAFSQIKSDVHLNIIGDGVQRKLLTKLIARLNLKDKVTLLGWQSNISHFLSCADIYIQSSVWEGFSIGILEAMGMGLPMIVSNAGALQEAIGSAGLIFPIGDAAQLASHLDSLAHNPTLRAELSQQSLSRVKQFSLENMWQEYNKLYHETANTFSQRSANH